MEKTLARIRAVVAFLTIPLIALVLASAVVMVLANEDAFARGVLCHAGVCFPSEAAAFWNKLLYDFGAGCVITVVFYWLLGRLPEQRKRERIKKSLRAQYRAFKLSCIENFLAVADRGFEGGMPEKLLSVDQFRDYFKEQVKTDRNRWHDVANNMTPFYLSVTLARMEILRNEISFAMHNTDLSDGEAFDFLKRLSNAIIMQRNATTEYDSIGSFLGFFWNLFAGWDWVEGYRGRDIVEEMIESI